MNDKPKQWPSSEKQIETRLDHAGRRLPRTAWEKGHSGNLQGRPPSSDTWAGTIRELSAMTSEELADLVGDDSKIGKMYSAMPKGTPIKHLIIARVLAALVNEPAPGLLSAIIDRMDGRLPLAVGISQIELSPEEAKTRILAIFGEANDRLLDDESADLIE